MPKPLGITLPAVSAVPTPPPGFFVEIFHRRPIPAGTPSNIDAAETARTQRPNDPTALRTLGLAYYAAGGYEAAARALAQAVAKAPEDQVSWLYLGYCHMARAHYPEAMEALGHVRSAESELQQGNVYFQALQKDADAEKHYRAAVQQAPQDGEPLLALGLLLASQAKTAQAQRQLLSAAQKLPPGPLRDTAYAALAQMKR